MSVTLTREQANIMKIKENISAFKRFKKPTEAMCFALLDENCRLLGWIPEVCRTEAVCKYAMEQEGYALADVPIDLRTEELCLTAVTTCGPALQHVPMEIRTETMCLQALKCQNSFVGSDCVLDYVPDQLKTAKLCRVAVERNGYWLKAVPEHLKTAEICATAVQKCGSALEFVPEELKTEELCLIAIKDYFKAFDFIPKVMIDQVATQALAQGLTSKYGSLRDIKTERRTLQVCLLAMKQNPEDSIQNLPSKIIVEAFQQLTSFI